MSVLARLWARRRERPAFVALASLTLASVLAWPAVDWWLRGAGMAAEFMFWDFGAYGGAVNRWLYGEPIYRQAEGGGYHGTYLYPPFTVAVFRQFAVLEFRQAAIAFEAVSVGLLWVGLQLLVRSLGLRLRWWERGGLLWALLGFHPLLLSLKMGQTAAFMAAMLCFAFASMEFGNDVDSRLLQVASGAFTAVVGTVKLAYAPVGAHLLRDRDRFGGAVLAGLAIVAFSLATFGVETHRTYLDVLRWGVERGEQARSPALWLAPYFRPLVWVPSLLGPLAADVVRSAWVSPLYQVLLVTYALLTRVDPSLGLRVAGSVVVAGVAVLAGPDADRESFALGVAAFPLLAPLAYTYYLVSLLPAGVALLAVELERDGHPALPVFGLLLAHLHAYGLKFLVDELPKTVPEVTELTAFYGLFQPGLWGALLLTTVALVRAAEAGGTLPDRRLAALWDRVAG